MIEAMGLKLLIGDPLEWHYVRTRFHGFLPSDSQINSGGQASRERQTGDLIGLLSFFESRLKSNMEPAYQNNVKQFVSYF
jgi:hypothetical protein